ncbi:helix-turn-helix domain-containing protein [Spirillospora sp. NPDC047279]|uniref:TetR/AcrR family transcriptional regulator n=1 Tax=Spirillospora sp. NPDC047279 TaxID=3155478 RepID=UPI0033D740EA
MGLKPADRLSQVLDATYICLTLHGVRRTTMDDIARQAGMSRSAVYQYVRNKDDAFRRLTERLHDDALVRARAAASAGGPPADRVRGVLGAKLDLVGQLMGASPHGAELLDAKARLFADVCAGFVTELKALLAGVFAEAGVVSTVTPDQAADICIALVMGLEARPDGAVLLQPAADALISGLLAAR